MTVVKQPVLGRMDGLDGRSDLMSKQENVTRRPRVLDPQNGMGVQWGRCAVGDVERETI